MCDCVNGMLTLSWPYDLLHRAHMPIQCYRVSYFKDNNCPFARRVLSKLCSINRGRLLRLRFTTCKRKLYSNVSNSWR
jgi:hypothetical protein